VLVSVHGPHEVSRRAKAGAQHDRAVLTCDYVAMPYATGEHKPQSASDRAAAEMAASIRRVFEPVVQTQLYPRSQIDVSICLLQSDGGVRSAAINATTLALIDAGVAMEDFVCACSAGSVHGALLLDLNAQEDGAGAEFAVAYLPRAERVSFVQLEAKVPLSSMEETLNFALEGCRQVYQVLRDAVLLRMEQTLDSRGLLSG
jgi:exosome complex component RRP41